MVEVTDHTLVADLALAVDRTLEVIHKRVVDHIQEEDRHKLVDRILEELVHNLEALAHKLAEVKQVPMELASKLLATIVAQHLWCLSKRQ